MKYSSGHLLGSQDGSVVGFFRIDPMPSDLNPPSAKLSLRVRRVASPLQFQAYESRGVREVSHREEGPGLCSISKKLLGVQVSTFDI